MSNRTQITKLKHSPPYGLIIPDPSKRKKFLVAPSGNRGSVRVSRDPSRSDRVIGKEEDVKVGQRSLHQKTSKRVAYRNHSKCPLRPPAEEDRATGVHNLEEASRTKAGEGGISRGLNCGQRVSRLRCRGPSVLLHSGLIESRPVRSRFCNGAKEEECVRGLVPSRPGDDSLGSFGGSKTSRSVSLKLSERHSSCTGQAKNYSGSPILGRSSSAGGIQFSSEVELHESPRQARSHGYKDSYSGSHVRVDPGERSGETATFNNLESRFKKLVLKNIPNCLKTAKSQFPLLEPFLKSWKELDIATCDIHEIPVQVFVSRLFTVPKDKNDVRPL